MTASDTLKLVVLPHGEGLDLPRYETEESAGLDLRAAVGSDEPIEILPGKRALIPTGLQMHLPKGTEGQIRPRSGLAFNNGVTVLNSPGTIDADYRGEVKVLLVNFGDEPFTIERGARIAQFVIHEVARPGIEVASELASSQRGAGGFGSTGQR